MMEKPHENQNWFNDKADDIFDALMCEDEDPEFVQALTDFDTIRYCRQSYIHAFVVRLQENDQPNDIKLVDAEDEVQAFSAVADLVMHEKSAISQRLDLLAGIAVSSAIDRAEHHNSLLEAPSIILTPWQFDSLKKDFYDLVASDPDMTNADYVEKLTDIYREGITNDTQTLEHNIEELVGSQVSLNPHDYEEEI